MFATWKAELEPKLTDNESLNTWKAVQMEFKQEELKKIQVWLETTEEWFNEQAADIEKIYSGNDGAPINNPGRKQSSVKTAQMSAQTVA